MTTAFTRRSFLQIVAATIAAGIAIPAMAEKRAAYVSKGAVTSFVGRAPGGFIGGQLVHAVHEWDGIGYPVDTCNNSYGRALELERYYDFDLADFKREIPPDFWHHGAHAGYPNVHTWLRSQRFGETMAQAIEGLNLYSTRAIA